MITMSGIVTLSEKTSEVQKSERVKSVRQEGRRMYGYSSRMNFGTSGNYRNRDVWSIRSNGCEVDFSFWFVSRPEIPLEIKRDRSCRERRFECVGRTVSSLLVPETVV